MTKPNLFIVGAAKCATTTLHTMLAKHSEIYSSKLKEPHYFPTKYREFPLGGRGDRFSYIRSEEEYLNLYKEGHTNYSIDSTVDHLYFKQCAKDIYDFNHNSKIIIMLRNPVSRAFSSYKHVLRDGREHLSFADSLRLEEKRIKMNYGIIWRYKDLGLYSEQVKQYLETFPRENIKIIVTETFEKNPEYILKDIQNWLDLPYEKLHDVSRRNVSGKPSTLLLFVKKLESIRAINRFAKLFINEETYTKFKKMNLKSTTMDKETENKLYDFFIEDIIELERLTQLDLTIWKKNN